MAITVEEEVGGAASVNATPGDEERDGAAVSPSPSSIAVPPLCGSVRLNVTLLGLFGFFNMYAQRVNLSVALVAMVNQNNTADNGTSHLNDTCPVEDRYRRGRGKDVVGGGIFMSETDKVAKSDPVGEFADWDGDIQAVILASFFYGYIVTQIPGGILAKRFGGKLLYGLGALCTSCFTLLTPLAARMGWKYLVAVRIIEGVE